MSNFDHSDYDDADVAELLRWLEDSVRGILAQYGGSQAELEVFEAPGALERIAEEMKISLGEVLERMGCVSQEQFVEEARADLAKVQIEIDALQQALASIVDGSPWPLWQETFGAMPTPGLLPVHLEVTEDKAEWPSFLHFHALNQRTDFLGAHALGGALLADANPHNVNHFTSWMFGVGQRHGLFLDAKRRVVFEALSSHPAVHEQALERFLSEQRFVLEVEWNVTVDEAVAKARGALTAGVQDPDLVLDATHALVAELLQMSPLECQRLYLVYRVAEKPKPRCR
ncbi:MAG: hypothetical protein ACI9KE_001189 [Polyangiales bacterium]|jgi:hypothetical protein